MLRFKIAKAAVKIAKAAVKIAGDTSCFSVFTLYRVYCRLTAFPLLVVVIVSH